MAARNLTIRDFTSGRSASPPDYTLTEDSRGNLVNKKLKVVWPQRPPQGYYSLNAHQARKANERRAKMRSVLQSTSELSSARATTGQSRTNSQLLTDLPDEMKARFAGVQSASTVAKHLKPSFSLLYYRQNSAILNLNALPLTLDLWLAHMDESGAVTHYAMKKKILNGLPVWKAEPSDEDQPYFKSLVGVLLSFDNFGGEKISFEQRNSSIEEE